MKLFFSLLVIILPSAGLLAQTTDKVSQLVSQENYFAALVKEKGIKKGFLSVSDNESVIFRPGPVKLQEYFKDKPADSAILQWEPVFAKISKSNDWGFTSGWGIYKQSDTSKAYYSDYLSVWKRNEKGVWKLALDCGVSHRKPTKEPQLTFVNPTGERFIHQHSDARLKQREDIVLSSDQLYATILKADNKIAHNEFLTDETRLLFEGQEPIIGKKAVEAFWAKQPFRLNTQPVKADRAYSGELAYTYGTATTTNIKTGKIIKYNYLRIWEVQPGFEWNVIFEVFMPAS
ncbi:DUF4440 domain-containing protein [Pedobacter sp. HMF7647]|uniref:DUF4440 domain-containing protein n=1 Tax=Hufsiella arboris TaxID=2695275 RepID=A0A7K1YCF9_9SPHI|nr:DUF4440 domain-containing protein [Hufsiella arboris]MXV51779.1 DUF4440 domain-containing protein [Hufsiella arboris]